MDKDSRDQILSLSSAWVAVVLNVFPGLGLGYIYQRRWKAYWLTTAITTAWTLAAYLRETVDDPFDPASLQGGQFLFYGLPVITLITALEAGYAAIKARSSSQN